MRRAPIRVRLTAWYVLVLAVVLLALGTFVVTRLRADLTDERDRGLRAAAAQIARGYRAEGVPELRDVTATVVPGPRSEGSGVQLLDRTGRVELSDGHPVTRAPLLDLAAVARVLAGERIVGSRVAGAPHLHLRVLGVRAERRGRPRALVVVESLDDVDDSVHRVLVLLLAGGAVALLLLGLGGWWVARRALLPVERMTARADGIGIGDLSERIAPPRARDEIGHLARTLNRMLGRLEAGVQARERLVADASHELRGPLAAMRTELEVSLRHDELAPGARTVLASARDEVVRLARIVDHLLTLARVDEGRLELLTAPEDLAELVARTVRAHRATAAEADVALVVEGEPVLLAADADRLDQVVGNLLDNALRFSPRGGEVRVSVWRNGNEAGVRIADAGPGVAVADRERIFSRFSRGDPARGRDGGAGLGLAISAEIVRAHGGRIWVEPGPGGGSAFVFALPVTH